MKTTSYKKMRQAIVNDLNNYSADAIYNNTYPLFNYDGYSILGDINYIYNIIENSLTNKSEDNLILNYKELFFDDKKQFSLSKKERDLIFYGNEKDLTSIFKFLLIVKKLAKVNTIFGHVFFKEAKYDENYVEIIDFKIISQELLTFLDAPIPTPKVFNIIYSAGEDFPKDAIVTDSNVETEFPFDDIAPIYFSLKKALHMSKFSIPESGKIFLNYGNGIYAKVLTRKNNNKIEPAFCLIQENDSFYRNNETSPGIKINNGLYIVTDKLIFEIYFNTHAFLN